MYIIRISNWIGITAQCQIAQALSIPFPHCSENVGVLSDRNIALSQLIVEIPMLHVHDEALE